MSTASKNIVIGLAGESLTHLERELIEKHQPLGFILFSRNCSSATQVKKLTKELKKLVYHPLIMIDQEGGRVNRLRAFSNEGKWPAAIFGKIADKNLPLACYATYLNYILIASELCELGINMNCAPVLDLWYPDAHSVIGDRAFSGVTSIVCKLARAAVYAMNVCNVMPMIKHMPGHGRATFDSHEQLPTVETDLSTLQITDFKPFIDMSDIPIAMTAHVKYTKLDNKQPVTTSPAAIRYIRKVLGYSGVLISDDLSMGALSGTIEQRAAMALKAGCDLILHCNGKIDEMEAAASEAYELTPALAEKLAPIYRFDTIKLLSQKKRAAISDELEKIIQNNT